MLGKPHRILKYTNFQHPGIHQGLTLPHLYVQYYMQNIRQTEQFRFSEKLPVVGHKNILNFAEIHTAHADNLKLAPSQLNQKPVHSGFGMQLYRVKKKETTNPALLLWGGSPSKIRCHCVEVL